MPASCMAVLAKPQAVSPPGTTPYLAAMARDLVPQPGHVARTPATPKAQTIRAVRSPYIRPWSWTSLPPTDSMERMSAPAWAAATKAACIWSQAGPSRSCGGCRASRRSTTVAQGGRDAGVLTQGA